MTDEEILHRFMYPDYVLGGRSPAARRLLHWNLDALHEVEARLTEEQWKEYRLKMIGHLSNFSQIEKCCLHASAEQKKKALAAVLRPVVERQKVAG